MSRITRTRLRTAGQGGTNLEDIGTRHRNQSSNCHDRCHWAITRLVLTLLATAFVYSIPSFGQEPNSNSAGTGAASIIGQVRAITARGQTEELAGVEVKLTGTRIGNEPRTIVSDDEGHFEFTKLVRGAYRLEASPEGFEPANLMVMIEPDQTTVESDLVLHIISAVQGLEVRADASEISTESSELKSSLTAEDIDNLPLPEQKFSDAFSLSPGVVRTPEGKLNFNGQTESEGILLLNSTENVDPVTGSFSISLPIDVIQSMTVHDAPETAEYGGFSGGLTQIETKAPSDTWHYRVHDFLPGFRGKNGVLRGIADFTPRFVFGGPLIKGKLNFTEEFTWEVRNQPVRGLAWPYNETRTRAFTSFTELQAILSSRHIIDFNVNVFPLRRRFADIDALIPQSASSNYNQNGVSVGISDSYQFGSGALLNTVLRYTRFDSDAQGQGLANMLITPEGWGGNFFDSWSRTGNELEFRPAFEFPSKAWHGQHELKVGVDVSRRNYTGTNVSHPIDLLREDGSLAEQIAFQGAGLLHGTAIEIAEFAEDHWKLNSRLAIDFGARVTNQSIGRTAGFGPHVAVAYSPRPDGKTVIRAGTGIFYGHVPLLAADFTDNPARLISFFDPSGVLAGEPILLRNAYLPSAIGGPIQFVQTNPGTSPRTVSAHFEVEQELTRSVSLTVRYLNSETQHLFTLNPLINTGAGASLFGLATNGSSHYDQFEVTAHARPLERSELNVSYVWSRARGDLNAISDLFVPFEQPVIRPNVSGVLSSDVPHRFVGWGVLPLPWKLSFSPVVDVHSGLPYSAVDVLQNYFGVPNNLRFPTYFSLDIKVYREFPLRVPFMGRSSSRKLRFGIYSIDVTNHQNANAVYSEVVSPFFGRFAGFDRRIDGFVIDILN